MEGACGMDDEYQSQKRDTIATVVLFAVAVAWFILAVFLPIGGKYRFLFPSVYLVVVLLLLAYFRFTMPHVKSGYGTRARAAQAEEIEALTLPHQAAPGVCWQCGSRVRAGSAICGGCGAAQRRPRK